MKYEIKGGNLPVVLCTLQPGETMVTESGAMSWMSPNMKMETGAKGGLGGAFGRMFSGESIFQNRYTAQKDEGLIAFASSFPGEIRAVDIAPGRSIVVQKRGFLACTEGVELSVFFQKKFGTGFFGGEGFIMQKLSGSGTAFLEIDGSTVEYDLERGQSMIVDTGYLAAMDDGDRQRAGRQEQTVRRRRAVQHRRARAGAHHFAVNADFRRGELLEPVLPERKQLTAAEVCKTSKARSRGRFYAIFYT